MKVVCMHLKIFICIFALAVILGIITVTPCPSGQKHSLLNRAYAYDAVRCGELCDMLRNKICCICSKK